MRKLARARVCVVGVGGVGSHTAHMLARAGLGHLRLIDFDQVTVSSLNRHAVATLEDVGRSKVECLAAYLRKICPDERYLKVETFAEMYTEGANGARLLQLDQPQQQETWDMVIDCIDDVPTKAALLAHCLRQKIRVVSCMGAGGKADPTRLHVSDLRSAAKDPLASKIRQRLKRVMAEECPENSTYLDDMDQLTILFSSETTRVKLADFTEEQKQHQQQQQQTNGKDDHHHHQLGAVDGMRVRLVPVLGTMPAIMGQTLASICVTAVAGSAPIQYVTGEKVGRNTRNKIYQKLVSREQAFFHQMRREVAAAGVDRATTEETTSVNGDGELIRIMNPTPKEDKNVSRTTTTTTTWIGQVQIDQTDDMEYLMEIWRNRCAVTGARLGVTLHLVRWDRARPSTCDNLVLVSANVLPKYEADPVAFQASMDPVVRKSIEERLASCRIDR